jgi:molybdate transport system ATP-binding protein
MIHLDLQHQLAPGFCLQLAAQLPGGRITALAGPSGAGKTTLLRLLAGLARADSGTLRVDGDSWQAGKQWLPPQQRRVGMVFQDYALFPHLNVRDNVAFGARHGDSALVDELLALTGLSTLARQRPQQLSGGQKQRVALARALACRPRLLLLDEPLSALDPALRGQLQDELLTLQQRYAITTVLVSHDPAEIFKLASHVLLLQAGRLHAQGSPAEVFLHGRHARSRLTLPAQVLAISPADILWRVTVQSGGHLVDLLLSADEAAPLRVGQTLPLQAGTLSPLPHLENTP